MYDKVRKMINEAKNHPVQNDPLESIDEKINDLTFQVKRELMNLRKSKNTKTNFRSLSIYANRIMRFFNPINYANMLPPKSSKSLFNTEFYSHTKRQFKDTVTDTANSYHQDKDADQIQENIKIQDHTVGLITNNEKDQSEIDLTDIQDLFNPNSNVLIQHDDQFSAFYDIYMNQIYTSHQSNPNQYTSGGDVEDLRRNHQNNQNANKHKRLKHH